ncbi:site-2 protease family protein [Thermoleptolyngbya sichuanensis A183]|uniref:Site-2 protease family protein n=1 Tax=Thermoleptolyngbya sichuanensis A183 TaxID=2737172 RepID=A0A6M8BBH7_9CYAN|nr:MULTISPECIES: site-2 protease family protein [Thermoleptolyngbya]QKD80911.1 site-2 protease family protein [Thermoleptolyngbya sichuanensis A183]
MPLTALILTAAIAILGWGFYRARPMGQVGILAWLQSLVLMLPWLLFFGLFTVGVYLNLAAVLLLIVASTGLYIFLGRRLRTLAAQQKRAQGEANAAAEARSPHLSSNPAESSRTDEDTQATTAEPQAPPSATDTAEPAKLPPEDLAAIREIFGIDTFFATETVPYLDGAIFKGNLRGEVAESHAKLSERLKARVGDRYRLFLLSGPDDRPTVVVLPATADPSPTTPLQFGLAGVLAIATVLTCLETAGLLQSFDLFADWSKFGQALPIALGLLLILGVHELGHRVVARRLGIRLGPPFFIPALQLGSFGSITRFASLLPNRKALFDIAVAGPLAGGLLSFTILILGLSLSHQGSVFQIPSEFFQGSILVGTLARVVLGTTLQQSLVDVHPLVIVGWIGLVITAINLMPAGQLDGGRIVQSIYGRKTAGRATVATLVLLGLVSLTNPLALYWAVLILFLQRELERPALEDLSEPDDARAALGLLVLFLMAATLLPLTPGLAGRLGIGG